MKNVKKVMAMTDDRVTTYEGGVGYRTTFKETLAEFFSLGLLNGNFYQSQDEVLKNARYVFERALREDPLFATKCAIYGNNVNSMKLVPTIWLVYLSTLEDKTLFRKAFPRIIRNPKMLHDFMEISRKGNIRRGLGRSVKREVNDWLIMNLNEYQVTRNKGKLSDVIKVTRPYRLDPVFQSYMRYISKDELSFDRAVALKVAISDLESGKVSIATLTAIEAYKLQLEELKHSVKNLSREDKQSVYDLMYRGLSYASLILNLVALERVFATKTQEVNKWSPKGGFKQELVVETDIPEDVIQMVVSKIENVKAYRKSNMLPFALITAERMVVTPEFKVAIGNVLKRVVNDAFNIANGIDLLVAVDTSGSMGDEVTDSLSCVELATLFGAMVKKAHTNTEVYAVATGMEHVPLNKQDDMFQMARQIQGVNVGAGTLFEQIMDKYKGEKYVLLFTDSMSADNLEKVWLKKKADGAKLIVWQLKAYETKVSSDPSVVYLRGYSDRLMNLVKKIIEGNGNQIEEINSIEL